MKLSQFKKLIREEIQKVLREGQETTLSQLQVGDKFSILEDALLVPANTVYSSTYNLTAAKYKDLIFEVVKLNPKTMVCIPYNKDGVYPNNVHQKLGARGGVSYPVGQTAQDVKPPILPASVAKPAAQTSGINDDMVDRIITQNNAWESGKRPKFTMVVGGSEVEPYTAHLYVVQFAPHKKDARVMTK